MGGRNKVNVVCALGDKFKINFAQAFHGNFLAFVHAADFVVLAKYAVQVAAAEKHGAAAFFAADAGFFPKVQGGAGNNGLNAAVARAENSFRVHIGRAVNTAAVRADITFHL